jgi:hypothetical protein
MVRDFDISRRELLAALAGSAAIGGLSAFGLLAADAAPPFSPAQPDLIRRENEKPGTRDWLLTNTRIEPATKYRCPWIEGYCSHTSIRAGEELSIYVSTNPASRFSIDIFRMGHYGGTGGRRMKTIEALEGKPQPDPPEGPKRIRDCRWQPSATFKIPADWPSGVYVGKLTAEREKLQSYVIFIVRDDRRVDFLFQCSDTTWQAYNRWPDHYALYDDGKNFWYWGNNVAFLSGNTCCGRIEFEKDHAGRPRIYERVDFFGPKGELKIVGADTLPYKSPSSGELVGARNIAPVTGGADFICTQPDHWVFAGTGMKKGDGIPGLVGWEWHGDPAKIPGLEVLATGPTQSAPGRPNGGVYTATIYPGPRGNFVFNASTCWWADGLVAPPGYQSPSVYTTPKGPDRRVQQITRNLLERMK